MIIETGKYVAIQYTLTGFENGEEPEDIEKTSPEKPFTFIFGMGQLLPAFEKNISGMTVGDKFDFTLSPDEAYGEYDDAKVIALPRKMFCDDKGVFMSQYVMEGGTVPLQNQNGDIIQATVQTINDSEVICDVNHPLAGMTMHFVGEVSIVREPTDDDKRDFVHASCDADGEGGCGGDCGSCGGSCGGGEGCDCGHDHEHGEGCGCGHCH